jgi:hypothetical protein
MRIKRLSEGIRSARISETLNESEMDSYVYKTLLSGDPRGTQSYVEIVSKLLKYVERKGTFQ